MTTPIVVTTPAELRRLGTTLESADVAPVDPVEAARAALGKVRRRSE